MQLPPDADSLQPVPQQVWQAGHLPACMRTYLTCCICIGRLLRFEVGDLDGRLGHHLGAHGRLHQHRGVDGESLLFGHCRGRLLVSLSRILRAKRGKCIDF